MGNENSKPGERIKAIDKEINKLNFRLKSTKRIPSDEQQHILETLTKYSKTVNSFKGQVKKKEVANIQKKISKTIQDIYELSSSESQLDLGAIETNSIIQMPLNKRTNVRSIPDAVVKKQGSELGKNLPTLKDIEDKLQCLCPLIENSLANKDLNQLRIHHETLKVLATGLEMIKVPEETPLGDKKKKIDAAVTFYYQKISKAMKEIRRSKDINYVAKHEKKIVSLQALKKELDEIEKMLKLAQNNNDTKAIKSIQETLVKISDKLSSIEVLDENTRNLKLQALDKLSYLQKSSENATSKSQSDFTKAQSNYEDLIKTIASGENSDKDDIKIKLQSLQSFVSTIESEDDDSLKRKKTLMNYINESLVSVSGDTKNLEPKYAEPQLDAKLVQNFVGSWKALQAALKTTDVTREEMKTLDKLLADIQNSIGKTRKLLIGSYDPQTNLKTSFNASAPNLYTSTPKKEKFVSSLSVDRLEPIRAKAKIYNLEPEQIRNVRDQKAKLKQLQQEKRFSEIDNIRTQVQYIKEKYEKSNQKQHLKHKLEKYANILEDFVKDQDPVMANNSKILLADIKETLRSFEPKKPSDADKFEENINKVQESVDQMEKRIHDFQGSENNEECKQIKQILTNNKDSLTAMNIPLQFNTINSQKCHIMNKIEDLLESLNMKVNNALSEETFIIKAYKNLKKLRDSVTRFNGAYKGVRYNQLEKDLNKLLIDAGENIKDKTIADEIVKDAEKYLQILEHRATKDQSFRHTLTVHSKEDDINMNNLKSELSDIRNAIESTPVNAVDNFVKLHSRLDLVKLGLDQLKHLNENGENQKSFLETEVETLKSVVDAKIAMGQQSFRTWSIEEKRKLEEQNKKAAAELDKIEAKLNELKHEIQYFIGTKSDKKFYELDESAIRLTIKMDDIELPKGSDLYDRKVNLLKEVHRFEEVLDLKAKETENLIQFENDIKDIENNFDHYINSTRELETLAERVKFLQSSLEASEINEQLLQRKKSCEEKMKKMLDKIKYTVHEKNVNEEKLSRLTLGLENLRRQIQSDIIIDDDVLKKINHDLSVIKASLQSLKNLNNLNSQHREDLYQEVEILNNLALAKQQETKEILKKSQEKERNKSDLEKIEHIMKTVKNEIDGFIGTSVDKKYLELDEIINRYINNLDVMKISKDGTLSNKKLKLLKDLHMYSERLLKRAKDTEEMFKFEQHIKEIERNSRTFNQDNILEKIQVVKENLQSLDLDSKLEPRRVVCLQKLDELSKRAKDSSHLEAMKQLNKIEATLDNLKEHVDNFQGNNTDRHVQLVNQLKKLYSELKSLQFDSNSDFIKKQQKYMDDIKTLSAILNKKTEENENYQKIIAVLNSINDRLNKCSNLDTIPKEMKETQTEIEHLRISDKLKSDLNQNCKLLLKKYNDITTKIEDEINRKISEMKQQIEMFSGEHGEHSEQYQSLEKNLTDLDAKMKKLFKDPQLIPIKRRLQDKIFDCYSILGNRIERYNILSNFESEVAKIEKEINGKQLSDKQKNALDERLIALQVNLGQHQVDSILTQRKNNINNRIMGLIKALKVNDTKDNVNDDEYNDSEDDGGTSV